ncbi:MAG: DNA adenine methylase [Victivallaceae bacterium]|nr:DNA adenine methylase [Victivallaceae bacterium]
MNQVKSPFPWFGGKGAPKIKNTIHSLLPRHDYYIEPFGGGASILLGKPPAKVEVYNDVNRGVVNFFRVIADVELFAKFMARAALLPVSRELFEEYARTWPGIHDPVEQAVRWYVVIRQSFGGMGKSFGTVVSSSTGGMAQTTSSWRSSFENLPKVHDRIQRVQIECSDWRDCLKRFQGPGWLTYCDPPYVLGARKAGGYEHELKNSDHTELIETLLNYDGAVMLSGYDNHLYAPLQKAGWDVVKVDVICNAAGHTRGNGLKGAGKSLEKQKRTECIWRNPEAVSRE